MSYRRIIITGCLKTRSELHIGTGDEEKKSYFTPQGEEPLTINTVLLNAKQQPYIPASTLRGYLRSQIDDAAIGELLFGYARQSEDANQNHMGALRAYDAQSTLDRETFHKISRTAIDNVTGTAKRHCLATHETIPVDTVFEVRLELDGKNEKPLTQQHIDALLNALETFNAESGGQLGKGKSTGQGCLMWKCLKVQALTEEVFKTWLMAAEAEPINKYFKDLDPQTPDAISAPKSRQSIEFQLHTDSPLLVNNPHDADLQRKYNPDTPKDERQKLVNLVFLQRGTDLAVIPGSTIKGWFRAHCRRILLTLTQGQQETKVDALIQQLFGSDASASLLRFTDAVARISDKDRRTQTFNAVDRFTGGVKDTALYSATGVWLAKNCCFTASILYPNDEKLEGWMKLLLLFAWQDAQQGDLVLGWGKSKGYGRLTLKTNDNSWQVWLDDPNIEQWEHDLHTALGLREQEQAA